MQSERPASLHQVKADWMRVRYEMAYVRLLFAAYRLKAILAREDKFNPYHDEIGRFTTADGAVTGTGHVLGDGQERPNGGDGRVRVAQAGGGTQALGDDAQSEVTPVQARRPTRSVRIGNRTYEALDAAEETMLIEASSRAELALNRVRELDPDWQPAPSLSDPRSARGAIDAYRSLAQQAEGRVTVIERGGVPLGFNAREDFEAFGRTAWDGLAKAGHTDAEPYIRGSAVTGYRYEDGSAFDEGYRSDYDLAIVSSSIMRRAREMGIQLRGGASRTRRLQPDEVESLGLTEIIGTLSSESNRDVTVMIYGSRAAIESRGPYLPVP